MSIWRNLEHRERNKFVANTLMTLCLRKKAPFQILEISDDLWPLMVGGDGSDGAERGTLSLKLFLKCCRGSLCTPSHRERAVRAVEGVMAMAIPMDIAAKIALMDVLGEMVSFEGGGDGDDGDGAERVSLSERGREWVDCAVSTFESVAERERTAPALGVLMKMHLKSGGFVAATAAFEEWLAVDGGESEAEGQCIDILVLYFLKAAKLSGDRELRERALALIGDRRLIQFENVRRRKVELINFAILFFGERLSADPLDDRRSGSGNGKALDLHFALTLFGRLCGEKMESAVSVNSAMRCLMDNGMDSEAISLHDAYDGNAGRVRLDAVSHVLALRSMSNVVAAQNKRGRRRRRHRHHHHDAVMIEDDDAAPIWASPSAPKLLSFGHDLRRIVDAVMLRVDGVGGGEGDGDVFWSEELLNILICFFGANCRWKRGDAVSALSVFGRIESVWTAEGGVDGDGRHRRRTVDGMAVSIGSTMGALMANGLWAEAVALYKGHRLWVRAKSPVLGVLYLTATMALEAEHLAVELLADCGWNRGSDSVADLGEFGAVQFVNALIECHGHFGAVEAAERCFGALRERGAADCISLSSMMKCYLDRAMGAEALSLFESSDDALSRSEAATALYLRGCAERSEFERGRRTMEWLSMSMSMRNGNGRPMAQRLDLLNPLISFHGECGDVLGAERLFLAAADGAAADGDEVDAETLSVMMRGYAVNGRWDSAIALYEERAAPHLNGGDDVDCGGGGALVFYLLSCRKTGDLERGLRAIGTMDIEGDCGFEAAPKHSAEAVAAVISFFAHFGAIDAAQSLFDGLCPRYHGVATVNAMLSGFATNRRSESALSLFRDDVHSATIWGAERQQLCYAVSTALRCCGQRMALEDGLRIIDRLRADGDALVLSEHNVAASTMTMLSECGRFEDAMAVVHGQTLCGDLGDLSEPMMAAVIGCLAKMGAVHQMLETLSRYERRQALCGKVPSDRIYCAALTAAAHSGFHDDAISIFEGIKDRHRRRRGHSIHPFLVNAFIDGLSRNGRFQPALCELHSFWRRQRALKRRGAPTPHWSFTAEMMLSILSSCRCHLDGDGDGDGRRFGIDTLKLLEQLLDENEGAPERHALSRHKVLDQIAFYRRVFGEDRQDPSTETATREDGGS